MQHFVSHHCWLAACCHVLTQPCTHATSGVVPATLCMVAPLTSRCFTIASCLVMVCLWKTALVAGVLRAATSGVIPTCRYQGGAYVRSGVHSAQKLLETKASNDVLA